mmetsp:Transcript_1570/g.4042  ORF Transcript_1570/g.4042 Transcript_1570/m.4042 type:complete len:957 (+) Transcript_1570:71-2941(+)
MDDQHEVTCPVACLRQVTVESADDERFHANAALVFLILWAAVMYQLVRVLMQERERYLSRNSTQSDFRTYLMYRFGHWYAWTHGSSVVILLLMSATLMVLGGVLHSVFAATPVSDSLWSSWIWIAAPDGGNSAQPGGYTVGVIISMGGMLIFAMLVSLITSALEDQLWHLRHGSIPVVEGNHIVILGFARMALILIEELCLAMESTGGGFIVVLAPQPKPDVEQQIKEAAIDTKKSTVVVRSGQPQLKEDLYKVAVGAARRILVLSTHGVSREEADSRTLNTLLTLASAQQRTDACIIVECMLVRNQRLFNTLSQGRHMETLAVQDFVGQLMVESSRQRGLSGVLAQVLGFDGDEFYVAQVQGVEGWTFRELLFAFPDVMPVGLISEENVTMLPAMDAVISAEDRLVFLSEDVSTLPTCVSKPFAEAKQTRLEANRKLRSRESPVVVPSHGKELVVILGWNQAIDSIIIDLDRIVEHGSEVLIYSDKPVEEREEFITFAQKRRKYFLRHVKVTHQRGSLGARFKMDELPLEKAQKIFLLAEDTAASETEADGRTIAAILQVRDILCDKSDQSQVSDMVIIPQVLTKEAEDACCNNGLMDCINSNRLSARVMASTCQSPDLCAVYSELLSETGARFCIRRIPEYMAENPPIESLKVSFYDVVALAASCGEIVIGWSSADPDVDDGSSIRWELNPKDKQSSRTWGPDDLLMVIGRQLSHVRNPRSLLQGAVNGCLLPKLRNRQLKSQASRDSLESAPSSESADATGGSELRRAGTTREFSPVSPKRPSWHHSTTTPVVKEEDTSQSALWRKSRLMSFASFPSRSQTRPELGELTEQHEKQVMHKVSSSPDRLAREGGEEEPKLEDMLRRTSFRAGSPMSFVARVATKPEEPTDAEKDPSPKVGPKLDSGDEADVHDSKEGVPAGSLAASLALLARLRKNGDLTTEEYAAAKAATLNRG